MATASTTVGVQEVGGSMLEPHGLSSADEVAGGPVSMPPFDPKIHLAFEPPKRFYSFSQLGLERPHNAPDYCHSEPFQLFSEEGVRMIRRELLSKHVLDKHLMSWPRAPCIISYHDETATWIRDMWHHPAVTACIEKAFGMPLKVLGRTGEIGHCNVQLGVGGAEAVYQLSEQPTPAREAARPEASEYDTVMTDSWHRDSTQLVVVVMLSDTSSMVGGETAIKVGDDKVVKARGTRMGGAVLLQGGHTTHAALRATNIEERISMVTSYTFADPDLDDSATTLRSVRPNEALGACIQDHFLIQKLERLKGRIDAQIRRTQSRKVTPEKPFRPLLDRREIEGWVKEQMAFLTHTSWELFERYPRWLYRDCTQADLEEYHRTHFFNPVEKDEESPKPSMIESSAQVMEVESSSSDSKTAFIAGLVAGASVAVLFTLLRKRP